MPRFIEIQDPCTAPSGLTLQSGDILYLNATGGRVLSGMAAMELLGTFVSAVLGTQGKIMTPMGPPRMILFRASVPGDAVILVVSGDPWGTSSNTILQITVLG